MNVDRYLQRISCPRPHRADLDGLRAIHRAHLRTIPYENLDVQLQRPLTIAPSAAYEKIVERNRGGWCYEMNGLLGWALGELGYRVTRATGAVRRDVFGELSVGNHLVLRIDMDEGVFLADTGFGDGPHDPFRIAPGQFSDGRFTYELTREEGSWWRFHNAPRGGGADTFDFSPIPADEKLFAEKCEFLQTSELSPFVQNLVCQRHTEDGVIILRGRVFRTIAPSGISEHLIENADEFKSVLFEKFTLDVPEAVSLWPKIVARHEALFAGSST